VIAQQAKHVIQLQILVEVHVFLIQTVHHIYKFVLVEHVLLVHLIVNVHHMDLTINVIVANAKVVFLILIVQLVQKD
jgi:hypothetical protein